MKVLAIDPGSQRSGYALLDGELLIDAGILKPQRTKDAANDRIRAMAGELTDLIDKYRPEAVVIEDTSGKVAARHRGGGAGLAVHGKSVGYFLAVAESGKCPVHAVLENDWTRGVPKGDRQLRIAARFIGYETALDPGGDVADAIGLAVWWMDEQAIPQRIEAA